jgi:hypothetical protein
MDQMRINISQDGSGPGAAAAQKREALETLAEETLGDRENYTI